MANIAFCDKGKKKTDPREGKHYVQKNDIKCHIVHLADKNEGGSIKAFV